MQSDEEVRQQSESPREGPEPPVGTQQSEAMPEGSGEGAVAEVVPEEPLAAKAEADTEAMELPATDDDANDDATDTAPLKLEREAEPEDSLENESPVNGLHSRDFEKVREPRGKLFATNWLADITSAGDCELVKVQFKNTRSGFYRNVDHLDLKIGDVVAVEAQPGHDIGQVVMVGPLVQLQLSKVSSKREAEIKKIFRLARPSDLEKFEEAKARETETMIKSRQIAAQLGLDMKIGDVEYQGDGGKAIFYYIADERVDFRKLIRLLADEFHVRIEMKQIGARQEAGRIGGIGPCGRPLCCSSWMTHFVSVGTSLARMQDLSMNPQKLAGQCAKLKCCLNFEAASYAESQKKLPGKDIVLQTKDADYYLFKTDILQRLVTYSTDKGMPANAVTIPARRAFEIIALNNQGVKVDSLVEEVKSKEPVPVEYVDLVGQDSLTRFDKAKRRRKTKKKGGGNQAQGQSQPKGQPKGQHPSQPKQKPQDARKPQDGERKEPRRGDHQPRKEGGKRGRGGKKQRPGGEQKQNQQG